MIAAVQPLVPAWRLDRTFDYSVPDKLREELQVGSLVRVPLGARKVRGVVRSIEPGAETDLGDLEEIASVVLGVPLAPHPTARLLDLIAERYAVPRGRVFARVVPPRVRVAPPESGGSTVGGPRGPLQHYSGGPGLLDAIATGQGGAFSLRFSLADDRADVLAGLISARTGGSALVIAPEVSYPDPVLAGLERRLGDAVRIDSSVGDATRAGALVALASRPTVGLGGRAAVLAPAKDLRLLIVLDEHNPALREDRSPRYDARWVALARADIEGAVCVLASDAPSMETSWSVLNGDYRSVTPSKEAARVRPMVHLAQPPPSGISRELHRAIREVLRGGGKVGILVPGSGFARAVWCAGCRRSLRCDRCEAGSVSERDGSGLLCPRCGERGEVPDRCPYCGSDDLHQVGAGSEKVASQIAKIFPRAKVARTDSTNFDPGAAFDAADIYVTTWVGTKPAYRPAVSLVGVISADSWIRRPDFRSAERAYQVFVAMAEWASPEGRVLIETSEPGHHAVQAVVTGDHDRFVRAESELRRELGYPPFSELVKIRATGGDRRALIEEATAYLSDEDKVLGPIELGDEALEVLVKTPDAGRVGSSLRGILPRVSAGNNLRVDVDPR